MQLSGAASIKLHFYKKTVKTYFLYGAEYWATKEREKRLKSMQLGNVELQ